MKLRHVLPLLSFALAMAPAPAGAGLTTIRVAQGLTGPIWVTAPPGDTARLFIVEYNTGRIKILKGGAVLEVPFLDLGAIVTNNGNFGLLGLAFHPDYAENGSFFVQYVDNTFHPTVARYQVSADPDVADAQSGQIVIQLAPIVDHQGGTVAFGPDGYLYVGFGDGQATDPNDHAQDDGDLHGKLLRLDVDGGTPYAIPPTNPFVGPGDPLDEIWAKGFRNPFRFSFDRVKGDLWIGDVGQDEREEIDFQPAASAGGENYGWRLLEGSLCFNPPTDCDPGGLTAPIYEYVHDGPPGCTGSVTGGAVYRGSAIPGLRGTYFFADFCKAQIWSLRWDGTQVRELTNRTAELAPGGGLSIVTIGAIGQDAAGELYPVDKNGGEIFKIVPTGSTPLVPALDAPGRALLALSLAAAAAAALASVARPAARRSAFRPRPEGRPPIDRPDHEPSRS